MKQDRDNIRVDLLKFRRKAYMSYPEGSPERKHFLKVILQNELQLTVKEMPYDLINTIVEGRTFVFWNAIKKSFAWFSLFLLCVAAFAALHTSFSFLFIVLASVCLGIGAEHLYDYWLYRKGAKVVSRYANDMKQYMNRISNDIKRLDGPYGH